MCDSLTSLDYGRIYSKNNLACTLQAVHEAGAGVIGEYDSCAFRAPGTGSFRGSDASNPHIGSAGGRPLETLPGTNAGVATGSAGHAMPCRSQWTAF